MIRLKLPPYQRTKSISKSIQQQKMIANTILKDLPNGTELLENQVAGHTFQIGTDEIGMLKDQHDGSVMKAAVKPLCGIREIQFYEQLQQNAIDPNMSILRELVPDYRGTVKMPFRGKIIDFIKLADITHDMHEPCVMDIKIGKRTWDPFASPEKILAEEQKYQACKQNLGFCIPGFQVYDIKSGRIKRFGKDYGKKLNPDSVKDALKIYLNDETGMCRSLLMKFLTTLWNIQTWARSQTALRFYSSSLLLVYDARQLKNQLLFSRNGSNSLTTSPNDSLSPLSADGTKLATPASYLNWPQSHKIAMAANGNDNGTNGVIDEKTNKKTGIIANAGGGETIQLYKQLQRSHSTQNNYDEDMKDIRKNYTYFLDNLIGGYNDNNKEWAFVKMIDFAHVFPADDDSIDKNYLFGIENLVKILEGFLKECDQ